MSDRYLVAPFWDDVDIMGGNGVISYEIHNSSGYYLDHVSGFIRAITPSPFEGTWMLVAYWDAVHPYVGSDNPEVSNGPFPTNAMVGAVPNNAHFSPSASKIAYVWKGPL